MDGGAGDGYLHPAQLRRVDAAHVRVGAHPSRHLVRRQRATQEKPCTMSQPSVRSRSSVASSSTPSATTASPMLWARSIVERTITSSLRVAHHAHHERLVDLELVQRQPAQVGERRIAGAVVVDRQLAAERAQALQVLDRMAGVVEDRALGDLERDPLRRAAVHLQQRRPRDRASVSSITSRADRLIDTLIGRPSRSPRRALRDRPASAPTA